MKRLLCALLACGMVSAALTVASAQNPTPEQVNAAAQKIIAHYQNSTCQQLAASKQQQPSAQAAQIKQKIVAYLKQNPQVRQQFINQIAAPIANKLFECGMIP